MLPGQSPQCRAKFRHVIEFFENCLRGCFLKIRTPSPPPFVLSKHLPKMAMRAGPRLGLASQLRTKVEQTVGQVKRQLTLS
jgi:hypothetical protein